MSKYIHKSHNVSVLLYHLVCPIKYRRGVLIEEVCKELEAICKEISCRYEIGFIEIGMDEDHVYFLIQSVPSYSVSKICRVVRSLTSREIFRRFSEIREELWGGEFWSDGYFVSTVGQDKMEEIDIIQAISVAVGIGVFILIVHFSSVAYKEAKKASKRN